MADIQHDDRPSKRVKLSPLLDQDGVVQDSLAQALRSNERPLLNAQEDDVNKKERDVGITVYVGHRQPVLRGLLKKRYTDFLVNEITPEGQVLHLTSLKSSKTETDESEITELSPFSGNGSIETGAASAPSVPVDAVVEAETAQISSEDFQKLTQYFNEEVADQIAGLYDSILSNPKAKPSTHTVVRTPFTTDRTLRAQIHQDIRRIFSSRIESQTDHSGTLVLSAAQPARPNNKQSRNRSNKLSWSERGGEHLHFNLYKENKDSMEMVNLLARLMKMNSKDLRIAGTKDRRAATVQRVSVHRVDAERLVGLNKTLRGAAVGDFEYRERGLELGELSGNEFEIALRDCEVETAEATSDLEGLKRRLTNSMKDLHEKGFVNFYGLQRFGTFAIRTDVVGQRILRGDLEGACDMILDFNSDILDVQVDGVNAVVGRDDRARAEAINVWRKTGRINAALDKMPKRFSAETNLVRHLGKNPSDFLGALLSIPRTQRTLYVHAYQSRVWNMVASERWKLFRDRVIEGDLVLVNEHKDKESAQPLPEIIDIDGEVVVQASAGDSSRTGDDIFERARHLTAEEVASGQYTIFDVVLPTPGWDIEYPKNASGEFYKTFMASEDGGQLDPHGMRRKQRDFSLSGSYRKVMARIGKDFHVDVKKYHGEDEMLLETDLDKIRRRGDNVRAQDEHNGSFHVKTSEQDGQMKLAVILKFQLASSQYATMALRELSKGGVREYKPEFSGGRGSA